MKVVAITPNNKYDYLAATTIEGLKKQGVEIIASDYGNGVEKTYTDDEIIEHSYDADYIFAIWGKNMGKFYLLDKIKKPEKTIYIDGSEWTYTGRPNPNQAQLAKNNYSYRRGEPWINEEMLDKAKWYFKRECYEHDMKEYGCIPFPFGILDEYYNQYRIDSNDEIKIDVFCAFGQVDTGMRDDIEKACYQLKDEGYRVIIGRHFTKQEYYKLMATSLITVDALGGGDCNARRWEVLASSSCLFSEKYNIIIPNDFVDGKHIVYYDSIGEFKHKIRQYIYNRLESYQIGNAGYRYGMDYHTSGERIKYLFDVINLRIRWDV